MARKSSIRHKIAGFKCIFILDYYKKLKLNKKKINASFKNFKHVILNKVVVLN